jgi:triosephosphate isomerase
MRSKIIIANWKLNGNWSFNEEFASALSKGLKEIDLKDRQIVICPPNVYLQQMNGLLLEKSIFLGSQDLSDELSGAFTGETSGAMLKDFGCRYVLVGHSERRERHFETLDVIVKKALNAISAGITPVICVGETSEQRQNGMMQEVLSEQIQSLVTGMGDQIDGVVLAYEPIWAIGTGETATLEQAQEAHQWLRIEIEKVNPAIAQKLPIIYGGSVKAGNAVELLQVPDIDGLLVGGASLVPHEFLSICLAGL